MRENLATILVATLFVTALSACSDSNNNNNNKCKGTETSSVRLFLQQLTDTSVVIKWRGEAGAACIGENPNELKTYVEATSTEGDHKEALFSGLDPQATYYYSIGGASSAPSEQFFTTAPNAGEVPEDGNTRIWLIGDSGTGGDDEREDHEGEAAQVLAGMESFIAEDGEAVDVFLMLGDNAYEVGSDFNYQQAVFELYTALLKNVSVLS